VIWILQELKLVFSLNVSHFSICEKVGKIISVSIRNCVMSKILPLGCGKIRKAKEKK